MLDEETSSRLAGFGLLFQRPGFSWKIIHRQPDPPPPRAGRSSSRSGSAPLCARAQREKRHFPRICSEGCARRLHGCETLHPETNDPVLHGDMFKSDARRMRDARRRTRSRRVLSAGAMRTASIRPVFRFCNQSWANTGTFPRTARFAADSRVARARTSIQRPPLSVRVHTRWKME